MAEWRLRQGLFGLVVLLVAPLLLTLLALRLWHRRKPLPGLGEKLTGRIERVPGRPVLVHGVSLGEVNLMRPLVPELERLSGARCLLTTSTTTGWQALGEQFPEHARAFWPFDRPAAVRTFLARCRPRLVVLLELEVWPVFLSECHARGIPVVLVNARVGAGSFAGYRRAGALLRPMLRHLRLALAQNGLWAARLRHLGVPHVRVGGSLKADMVRTATAAQSEALLTSSGLDPTAPILLLASTSAGADGRADEEAAVLGEHLVHWRERGWQVVIAPRHPERGPALATLVERLGGAPRRTSQGARRDRDDAVLIVDEIGKLAALYALCARSAGIAVVGGSLGSGRGGQNLLEAAAAGCCTVVGPDTRNFPDAVALLREVGGVIELTLPVAHRVLGELAGDAPRRAQVGAAGRLAWEGARGALPRVLAQLAGVLH